MTRKQGTKLENAFEAEKITSAEAVRHIRSDMEKLKSLVHSAQAKDIADAMLHVDIYA